MPKRAVAIRHVMYEDLGSFESILAERGFNVEYLEAGYDDLNPILNSQPELLFILGGPIGVYEKKDYPFINDEIETLKYRLKKDLPTLGICLGCQMIAAAAGAEVYPGPEKVIGWKPIQIFNDGQQSVMGPFSKENLHVLQWQGDTFDLPVGAVHLAGSDIYENQAFKIGENILGIQFHPEVTVRGLEKWFIGHIGALKSSKNTSLKIMRETTIKYAGAAENAAVKFFNAWMDSLQLT